MGSFKFMSDCDNAYMTVEKVKKKKDDNSECVNTAEHQCQGS